MDCLMKTVRSEGYFGMYRGETLSVGTLVVWTVLHQRCCRLSRCFSNACRRSSQPDAGNPREGHQTGSQWLFPPQAVQRWVSGGPESITKRGWSSSRHSFEWRKWAMLETMEIESKANRQMGWHGQMVTPKRSVDQILDSKDNLDLRGMSGYNNKGKSDHTGRSH